MSETRRNALIIGASRGLGLGLVRQHLARGWHVTATVRTPSDALAALGGELEIETLDMDRREQIEALAGRLQGRRFDLLFVNAGVSGPRETPIGDVPVEEINRVFNTNAVSPIRLADRLYDLVAPDGTIAFMSSILGSVAANTKGGTELYRASKAALNTLARSFVARHADARRTVLSVHPGWVRTDMGGEGAPLDVETSTRGMTDMLERRHGSGGHAFVDYRNQEIPW
ncbi:MAG: SDR family oxidoreductase [Acidisphaera sp.]|nr:SDR family oxidoreductase [Acidisphaera sp.]